MVPNQMIRTKKHKAVSLLCLCLCGLWAASATAQDSDEATAEAGAVMIEAIVDHARKFVAGMIDGTNVAEIPPFF